MRNYIYLILCVCVLSSCKNSNTQIKTEKESVAHLLSLLNTQDTIPELDLSGRQLTKLPDLSKYKVRKLNLSHNNLTEIDMKNLPVYFTHLNCSHNKIKGTLNIVHKILKGHSIFDNNISKHIKDLDFSHNQIEKVTVVTYGTQLRRLNLSDNDLRYFIIAGQKPQYLNLSNNKKFSNKVDFDPNEIDTIISKNIMTDLPLELVKPPLQEIMPK